MCVQWGSWGRCSCEDFVLRAQLSSAFAHSAFSHCRAWARSQWLHCRLIERSLGRDMIQLRCILPIGFASAAGSFHFCCYNPAAGGFYFCRYKLAASRCYFCCHKLPAGENAAASISGTRWLHSSLKRASTAPSAGRSVLCTIRRF